MAVTLQQVKAGVNSYVDAELGRKAQGVTKFGVYFMLPRVDKMVDKSCDEKTIQKMREVIASQAGVENIDLLQTRLFGAKIYVDIEIAADKTLSLENAHEIAQRVHDAVEKNFPLVKHCMVHVNPM